MSFELGARPAGLASGASIASLAIATTESGMPLQRFPTGQGESQVQAAEPPYRDVASEALRLLRSLGAPALLAEVRADRWIGPYVVVLLDCDARRAMEYWLRAAPVARREVGMPIFVAWAGEANLAPEELGRYAGEAMAVMDVFLAFERPSDVRRELEEEWE